MARGSFKAAILAVVASVLLAVPAAADPPAPPQNVSPPVLSPNAPVVGAAVMVTPGTWAGEDATSTVSYQWLRAAGQDLQPIPGATGTSYTVTTSDEGGLEVLVTVTADSGAVSTDAYSNAIGITIPSTPINVIPPVISGKGIRGATLRVSPGTWSQYPSPIAGPLSYRYQWIRCAPGCSTPIPGAVRSTYSIQPADWGRGVAVAVTATDHVGSTIAYSSGLAVTPPLITDDDPPWGRWIAGDPMLISPPPNGECFGATCPQGSVSRLLRNDGFRSVLAVKRATRLAVLWIARRAGREVTLGSERASFPRPGKYRTRFRLNRQGRSLLRSARGLHFLVASWIRDAPGALSGCAYEGTVTAARQISITPNCEAPPDDVTPF